MSGPTVAGLAIAGACMLFAIASAVRDAIQIDRQARREVAALEERLRRLSATDRAAATPRSGEGPGGNLCETQEVRAL